MESDGSGSDWFWPVLFLGVFLGFSLYASIDWFFEKRVEETIRRHDELSESK